ncbi:MAG TPA: spermidine synthase [Spongiibacteraceae bacterium]|jgi:spermidine synthase
MPLSGKEIFRTYDEFGPVQVFDDGTKRYLSFGEGDEQSCVLKTQPYLLQHDYTRAMLLPLLFAQPRDAILVGLGGGALVSCLLHHLTDLQLRVIELRHAVVKIARRYFELPRLDRLTIIEQDIAEFLDVKGHAKTDILFSDIYDAEGMAPQYFEPWYIEACAAMLNDSGWLVLNCWDEHRGERETLQTIAENFAEVYTCTVPSGNWIILASKQSHITDEKELKATAKLQSKQFGYSVNENLNRLYQVYPKSE